MALCKSVGLEELVDADSGREVVVAPAVVNRFADLTKKYEPFLVIPLETYNWENWLRNHVQEILLPHDINLFLQQTRDYENNADYNHNTGQFISQLLQNSYHAGNSDFELDMNLLKPINYFASRLSGTEERMVRVVIKGEVGDRCGRNAQYSAFTIGEAGKYCGFLAENSTFTVQEAGYRCGSNAQYSTFTIEKAGDDCGLGAQHSAFTIDKAGDGCGMYAQHSTLTIEKAENWCGRKAQHSTFKTHNVLQYKQLKCTVPRFKNNKVYHLQPDGTLKKRWF